MRSLEGLGIWQGRLSWGRTGEARVLKDCDEERIPVSTWAPEMACVEGPWRTSEEDVDG